MHTRLAILGLIVSAAALASCQADRATGVRPSAVLVDDPLGAARIDSVRPAAASFDQATEVTVYLSGILAPISGVQIAGVPASGLTTLSDGVVRATVGPFERGQLGRRDVSITLANGASVTRARSFAVLFNQDPVIFVHGCPMPAGLGSVTNYYTSTIWRRMYTRFDTAGYPALAWTQDTVIPRAISDTSYLNVFVLSEDDSVRNHQHRTWDGTGEAPWGGHCGSGYRLAAELREYIARVLDATGAQRVDVLSNSGSALGTRYYLKRYKGTKRVRDIVFLAGMNHGTDMALLLQAHDSTLGGTNAQFFHQSPDYDAAREGTPAYSCAQDDSLQVYLNGCLLPGSRVEVDETPDDVTELGDRDGVAYRSIYNLVFDELIEPTTSACLNQRFLGDCTDPVNVPVPHATDPKNPRETPHGAIRLDPAVIESTYVFVTARSHKQPKQK